RRLGLFRRSVEIDVVANRAETLLEAPQGLAEAAPQLGELRGPEKEQSEDEDDQNLAETQPHPNLRRRSLKSSTGCGACRSRERESQDRTSEEPWPEGRRPAPV